MRLQLDFRRPQIQVWASPPFSLLFQICGGFRAETCTPAQCEGSLCPQDGGMACGDGLSCRGAGPLAGGALRVAGKAAGELDSLSARLRETAQLVSASRSEGWAWRGSPP